MNRRKFLRSAAAGLFILPSAKTAFAAQANERLNLAVFGTMYNSEHFLTASHIHNAQVVAICNADGRKVQGVLKKWEATAARLEKESKHKEAADRYRKMAAREEVKIYSDVRKMFAEMGNSIDALVVSEYDHLHGVSCGAALRAGKPVCSERPIGVNILDARKLRALATETKLPTTYRSPGTGNTQFRRAMELVEEGVLGEIKEVHFWFKRTGPDRDNVPTGKQPVPEGLDWNLWLGPLAWREYHRDWMSYSFWRETCNGGLGVFGMHTGILPFMTLRMRELWRPSSSKEIKVTAECARLNKVSFPRWERVRWEIPARKGIPPVIMTWHLGPEFSLDSRDLIHAKMREFGISTPEEANNLMREAGSMLIGSEGAIIGDDHSVKITYLPRKKFEKIETNKSQRIPATQGIYGDWINACRGGNPNIIADFDNGGCLSELLMIGNIATLYPGETLSYNPLVGRITNKEEANQSLGFTYREGWRI